jgi:glycosyltransferase involved in cell wall biosynthesis
VRIAIDVRDLGIARTGIKTYLEELCQALPMATSEHQFLFLAPRWAVPGGRSLWSKIVGHLAFYFWKEIELPWRAWREGCRVIFCADYVVPLLFPGESLAVFHDASFWERPQDYNPLWRSLLDLLALPAARRSPAVITVSVFSKRRLALLSGISTEKLHIVYEAPKSSTLPEQSRPAGEDILQKYHLEERKFLLHVGVFEKRKNLSNLIKAFATIQQQLPAEFKLVLVGQAGPKQNMDDSRQIEETIQNHNLEDAVVLTGYISDDELAVFYRSANCYVFPSIYEGFGLPLLEAFANDLPTAAANAAALPEIAPDGALLFDPTDPEDMARQIIRVISDNDVRQRLVEAGRRRLADFSWEKSAQEIISIMEVAAASRMTNYDASY